MRKRRLRQANSLLEVLIADLYFPIQLFMIPYHFSYETINYRRIRDLTFLKINLSNQYMASTDSFFPSYLHPSLPQPQIIYHSETSHSLLAQCLGHGFYSAVLELKKKVPSPDHHDLQDEWNGTQMSYKEQWLLNIEYPRWRAKSGQHKPTVPNLTEGQDKEGSLNVCWYDCNLCVYEVKDRGVHWNLNWA